MKFRKFRIFKQIDSDGKVRYYPQHKIIGRWRYFYYTKSSDIIGFVYVRSYSILDKAEEFLDEVKNQKKFHSIDCLP